MRRVFATLILCTVIAGLDGCVLAVGNDGDSSGWSHGDTDNSLARTVRASLDSDPVVHAADITVRAEHGHVYLSGTTHSPDALTKALQLALDTPDVKSVHCDVTVIR